MRNLKNLSSYQQHTLQQDRLVFDFSIVANAVPASKKYSSDIPGLTLFRTQGHTAEADALESITWTTPDDDNSGDSVFGLLLNLDHDEADKVYTVMLCNLDAGGPVPLPSFLGTASTYGVLAASTITNTGSTTINGDLGLYPGTSVTGAPVVTGASHITDAAAQQAQLDALAAWNYYAGLPSDGPITAGGSGLDALILAPGVYTSASSMGLSVGATLTLDAGGDANAEWVFQAGSTVTLGNGSTVSIINGGSAANVYWQVGSSATIGTTADAAGTIIADQSITLNTGASLDGRALALNAAVTLDTNVVTVVSSSSPVVATITGPNGAVGPGAFLTPEGNIAIEFSVANLNLSTTDATFTLEVDYRERTGQP